jgi:16S rRNA (uracil1498-N3)-methyltransferase
MLPRFLVPDLDPSTGRAVLPEDEAHHLKRVLRLRAGDEVAVFDGRGREFRARVESAASSKIAVTLLEAVRPAADPPVAITLVQSVLKGQGMDDVVRDATMMGVEGIQPVVAARSLVKAPALHAAVARWRRIAVASAKQCRRARVPEIHPVLPLDRWLGGPVAGTVLLFVEPAVVSVNPLTMRRLQSHARPHSASVLVGPEGGWSDQEVAAATAAGCLAVTLGPLTLRADAVALAALAALSVVWGE